MRAEGGNEDGPPPSGTVSIVVTPQTPNAGGDIPDGVSWGRFHRRRVLALGAPLLVAICIAAGLFVTRRDAGDADESITTTTVTATPATDADAHALAMEIAAYWDPALAAGGGVVLDGLLALSEAFGAAHGFDELRAVCIEQAAGWSPPPARAFTLAPDAGRPDLIAAIANEAALGWDAVLSDCGAVSSPEAEAAAVLAAQDRTADAVAAYEAVAACANGSAGAPSCQDLGLR